MDSNQVKGCHTCKHYNTLVRGRWWAEPCHSCGRHNPYSGWESRVIPTTPIEEIIVTTKNTQVGGDHYQESIQPFDIIKVWKLGYFRGNVLKYLLRCLKKNGKQDLEKARHYLDHCIENYDELVEKGLL